MERLRKLYILAFQEYSERAHRLQSLTEQPHHDQAAIDKALLDLEKARLTHNACRDALANALLRCSAFGVPSTRPKTDRVRAIAGLRWEASGRPEGTAEEDWYRAEDIVTSAA